LRPAIPARNPQRRQVLSRRGQPPRADEGNADGSGAIFRLKSNRKLDSLVKKSLIEGI
jgi:hypothetical protein